MKKSRVHIRNAGQAAQVELGQFLCTLMKADMSPQALSTAELLTGPLPSAAQHVCQA